MFSPAARMMAVGLALAACIMTPEPASAGVVVAASGPSANEFPVGRKIGDNERIVLRAGDTLTVLDGRGTRVLRGAGTFSLNRKTGTSKASTFAVLTERRSARRMRTGAVRGEGDGPVHAPNLWYVDVARPGTMCLADADEVRLWRRFAEGDASYRIDAVDAGSTQTVAFADGEILAVWDTGRSPIATDSRYRITDTDGSMANSLSFVVLDEIADEPEALAEQLIENGCTGQLELLSTATMIAER